MDKIERKHYLKHYQGGFAMVLGEGQVVTGQIEEIDMEDGSVLVKAGERSQWVDGENVTPALKSFADFACNKNDIATVVNHIVFQRKKMKSENIENIFFDGEDLSITMKDDVIYISKQWHICATTDSNADNIGTLIFLLCELGYDVTGIFNK